MTSVQISPLQTRFWTEADIFPKETIKNIIIDKKLLESHRSIIQKQLRQNDAKIDLDTITSLCRLVRYILPDRNIQIAKSPKAVQVHGLQLVFNRDIDLVKTKQEATAYVSLLNKAGRRKIIAKGNRFALEKGALEVAETVKITFNLKQDYRPFVQKVAETRLPVDKEEWSAEAQHRIKNIELLRECQYMPHTYHVTEFTSQRRKLVKVFQELACSDFFNYYQHSLPSEENKLRLAVDILRGVSFMHKNGFVHKDLKIENILVHRIVIGKKVHEHATITDLAGACNLKDPNQDPAAFYGSPLYLAPEMFFSAHPHLSNRYYKQSHIKEWIGEALDGYGIGSIFWNMDHSESSEAFGACYAGHTELEKLGPRLLDPDMYCKMEENEFEAVFAYTDIWINDLCSMVKKYQGQKIDSLPKLTAALLHPHPLKRITVDDALSIAEDLLENFLRAQYAERRQRNVTQKAIRG